MWISVEDKLPEHNQAILVIVIAKNPDTSDFIKDMIVGVADYDKHFGFEADASAYEIYALDDSGLEISLGGEVSHWMPIPTLNKGE